MKDLSRTAVMAEHYAAVDALRELLLGNTRNLDGTRTDEYCDAVMRKSAAQDAIDDLETQRLKAYAGTIRRA